MKLKKATHRKAEDKYDILREHSRSATLAIFPELMTNSQGQIINIRKSVQLTGIDFRSRVKVKAWEDSPFRRGWWNWSEGFDDYAWYHPKRFELAIWYRELFLCGLSVGRPTWGGSRLRLDFIEASPASTPLSGLISRLSVFAAEAYAQSIGAEQVRIMHPVNERVRDHYLNSLAGFSYDAKGDFCFKDLV